MLLNIYNGDINEYIRNRFYYFHRIDNDKYNFMYMLLNENNFFPSIL